MSPPATHKVIGAAIGAILALAAIATALILAAAYPALDGRAIVVVTVLGIAAIALVVVVAITALFRLHLPSGNGALVFW